MSYDVAEGAALLRELLCFALGFGSGCLWLLLGFRLIRWFKFKKIKHERRRKRLGSETRMAVKQGCTRKGEVNSSLIFVAFAVATLLPTLLLMINAKPTDPLSPEVIAQVDTPAAISTEPLEVVFGIYDNPRTAAYCVAGAVMGAFLSLTVFPGKAETNAGVIRQLAAKFGSSMAVAIAFGPSAMDYFGVTRLNSMLAISAGLSLCGVSALHQVGPLVVTWFVGRAKTTLNIPDNENK